MTYCCGLLLKDGLVMVADTRTNAGVDNISTFRKLHLIRGEDRLLAIATAGNLSVTQSALSILAEGAGGSDEEEGEPQTLHTVKGMFRAAQLLGDTLARVKTRIAAAVEPDIEAGATVLFGGQIGGGPMRLFLIYAEGNFIECSQDTPFFQIGECKYGKPILLRSMRYDMALNEALKIVLVSFDSTLRSNLAVGLPLDLIVLRRDALTPELEQRIEVEDPYFHALGQQWSDALRTSLAAIPAPPYGKQ